MADLPREEIQRDLKAIFDFCAQEDMPVRERQIRTWRALKFYWDGYTNIWWSDVAHDWKVWDQQVYESSYGDAAFYDKRINIFRPYLESIFAALSTSIPPVKCYPDDADNPLDLTTAKVGNSIAELLYKQWNMDEKWLHALFIWGTEGLVAAHTYVVEDEEYGTYEEKEYKDETVEQYICPSCGSDLPDDILAADEYDPSFEIEPLAKLCPTCMEMLDPALQKTKLIVPRLVGTTTKPKSRVKTDLHGGLSVKVPNYARNQSECPYLIYSYEVNYVEARARYPHLKDKVQNIGPGSRGNSDPYERWGRTSTQYLGDYPINTVTCREVWLRPCSYYYLDEEGTTRKEIEEKYPHGCKLIYVGDQLAEVCDEKLDDHWTLTQNPMSDHVHFQPQGMLATSGQDITNELLSLTIQTIEHGIPQTFADGGVLNFAQYRQTEVAPGFIYPATPKAGKSMADAFYEVKTAALSQEVLPFGEQVQQLTQLSTGALPSLFGGAQPNSSKTASQYITSKNQATQRLQTTWKMMCLFWKTVFGKAIPAYIKEQVEDERYVTTDRMGNFTNVFIRLSELQGKIGSVELEAAENLPMSWMQKRDAIMQFLEAANPVVMQALVDPVNLPVLAETLGLTDLELPGENDRQVQLQELVQLGQTTPIIDPMTGMEMPSVSIEPDLDNHEIHIQICKNQLTSEAGQLEKIESPETYMNKLLHMKMHVQFLQQMMAQQAMMQAASQEGGGEGKPQNDKTAAPDKGQLHESTI